MKKIVEVLLNSSIFIIFSCNEPGTKETKRQADKQFTRQIENIHFTFPSKGYAYENRDKLIEECIQAIKANGALIGLNNYSDTINLQFLNSRQEMKNYTGMTASGIALLLNKKVYVVVTGDPKEVKPPIRHELMHMIAMTTWGYPGKDSNWMNEGLAALAENNCNGYDVEEIYRYLQDKNMLVPMDNLTTDFYKQPEMIAYHQAAYLVQSLLNKYGVEKFKNIWTEGFAAFEKNYRIPFLQVQTDINKAVKQNHPLPPQINWNSFQRGCI